MTPREAEKFEHILAAIDAAVGPPSDETPQEREKRLEMIARAAERRRIHRAE